MNPSKYPLHNINYFGFHVDDHPSANISRWENIFIRYLFKMHKQKIAIFSRLKV